MWLKEILDHFKTEGRVVKQAPFAFIGCVAFAICAIFIGLGWHYSGIIKQKDATIARKDSDLAQKNDIIKTISEERDSVNRQNDKLQHDNDWLRNYRAKDSLPLKQNALNLARQIHTFIKGWKDTDDPQIQMQNVQNYMARFALRASIMRDNLDQSGVDSTNFDAVMYHFNYTYSEVGTIADEIEKLANTLPDAYPP